MAQTSLSQQVLAQVSSLALSFASHVSGEVETKGKIDAMYKILVTGNGEVPLPETVRQHCTWIQVHDADREEVRQDARTNVREDRNEAVASARQIRLLIIGQVVTFLLLGLSVALNWK